MRLQAVRGRAFRSGVSALFLLVMCAAQGNADPDRSSDDKASADRKSCKVARKTAKDLEQSAHLRQAREALTACAKASCGALIRQECLNRYAQLGSDIPTIVPLVTDQNGAPRVDVSVAMDGEVLTSRLDGRALSVDPGMHQLTFTNGAGGVITQQLMIVQGQRNQPVRVAFNSNDKRTSKTLAPLVALPSSVDAKVAVEKPAPASPVSEGAAVERSGSGKPDTSDAPMASLDKADEATKPDNEVQPQVHHKSGPGVLPYALGGVGLVGVGAFGLLTLWGRKDNEQLGTCSPDCAPASVDRVRKLYLAADISLGVGLVALGGSVAWFALRSGSSKEKPPSQAAYVIDVQPMPSGGFATVRGAF